MVPASRSQTIAPLAQMAPPPTPIRSAIGPRLRGGRPLTSTTVIPATRAATRAARVRSDTVSSGSSRVPSRSLATSLTPSMAPRYRYPEPARTRPVSVPCWAVRALVPGPARRRLPPPDHLPAGAGGRAGHQRLLRGGAHGRVLRALPGARPGGRPRRDRRAHLRVGAGGDVRRRVGALGVGDGRGHPLGRVPGRAAAPGRPVPAPARLRPRPDPERARHPHPPHPGRGRPGPGPAPALERGRAGRAGGQHG